MSRAVFVAVMALALFGAAVSAADASMEVIESDSTGKPVTLRATATHYVFPRDGNTCDIKDHMCLSVSDGFDALWVKALGIKDKCDNKSCRGSCDFCCAQPGPGCDYGKLCSANGGGYLCVRCVDTRSKVCRHHNWRRVKIADACPRYHPCNTCKGKQNPCAQGRAHVDLCDATYNNIAYRQPDWKGLNVEVSTKLSLCP